MHMPQGTPDMFIIPFPQEIIDHIIDCLYNDTNTLINTNAVCRAWHHSSRGHLFHRIELSVPDSIDWGDEIDDTNPGAALTKYNALLALLDHNLGIEPAIREVVISHAHLLGTSSWRDLEPTLSLILRKLRHVQKVRLSEVYFGNLSSDFQESLLIVCRSASVTNLDVWNCQTSTFLDLTRLIASLLHLKTLQMSFVRAKTTQRCTDLVKRNRPDGAATQLHSLGLESCPLEPVINWLLDPESSIDLTCLDQLRVIQLEDTPHFSTIYHRLIRVSGHSLRSLDILAPRAYLTDFKGSTKLETG